MEEKQQARTVVPCTQQTTRFSGHSDRSRAALSSRSRATLSRDRRHNGQSDLYITALPRTDKEDSVLEEWNGDSLGLSDNEKEKKKKSVETSDIKREIYKRECARCNVVPVSAYLRAPADGTLVIRHYNFGPNGARALSAPLMLDNTLTHMDLVGNAIESQGLVFLLHALSENKSVRHLDISDNNLRSSGAKVLGKFMQHSSNTTLEHLVMSENGFKDEDGLVFARAIRSNRSLKEIVLSHNLFGDVSGPALGKALVKNDTLEIFDISWNLLRKKSAATFISRIKDNTGLKKLNLGFNGLGSEGATEMAMFFRTNRRLEELDISHNRVKDLDSVPLAKGLARNDTLNILRIGDNLLTAVGATAILHCLYDPRSICALTTLDFHTTNVDLVFERCLKELKAMKTVEVIHGRVMKVGQPPQPTKIHVQVKTDKEQEKRRPGAKFGVNTMTVKR